jgi:hypothetical protein
MHYDTFEIFFKIPKISSTMENTEIQRFLLAGALDYLNQLSPERRQCLGPCYLQGLNGAAYVVTFIYTDKWEIGTCVKWIR